MSKHRLEPDGGPLDAHLSPLGDGAYTQTQQMHGGMLTRYETPRDMRRRLEKVARVKAKKEQREAFRTALKDQHQKEIEA